jgi:starch phosphorylase
MEVGTQILRSDRAVRELAARLPEPLAPLARVAFNFRWSWTEGGPQTFAMLDKHRWALCGNNPVRLLEETSPRMLAMAAADESYVERCAALEREINDDLARPALATWPDPASPAAFLCAEYAIHQSLPLYAGGLGVLAGDILKEASDRALPMVALGLLYRQGYLHQQLDTSGWQREHWIETDPERLPMTLVDGPDGSALTVEIPVAARAVVCQVWRVDVGRVPLLLLDANRPENERIDRWITSRVYVGDRRTRLAQYAMLGVGGARVLRALGIEPAVVHLNEGHAALAPLELTRELREEGVDVDEALRRARSKTVFTTHTPLAAGNESYSAEEFREVLGGYPMELGLDEESVCRLGRTDPEDRTEWFGVTPFALRMSRAANGVSVLHGATARRMWRELYPGLEAERVPIGHVTNGVHLPTWMRGPMRELLDQYLGEGWLERTDDPATWARVDDIPDEELWAVRNRLRADLVAYVRDRSVQDRLARGEAAGYAEAAAKTFHPEALTIGFARRAAAYKRLHLLIHDRWRALHVLESDRPVQIVLAGKSHPQDEEAKRIVQSVFGLKWESHVAERVVFLEDYDIAMAAQLVGGCDVWVNVPRKPLEASGTSGMKAALNGGLNLSVLDGWWLEACDWSNGWGIESNAEQDPAAQDAQDAAALYDILEREVVPLFYHRDESGIPRGWLARVRSSLKCVGLGFTASRMLNDYVRSVYLAPQPG